MLEELKERVCIANKQLEQYGLVKLTWGNVSGIDINRELIVIKPSGVSFERLTPDDLCVVDLNGKIVEGKLNPSSDLPTHLVLYRHFNSIGGVVHTHSTYATAWAQAGKNIPVLGTTHADSFYGDVPCARGLTPQEINESYEHSTGEVIVETFANIDPDAVPGVILKNHGPFTWGKNPEKALENSVILEECAKLAYYSLQINPNIQMDQNLVEKHYQRKHGKNAYYGQK
ncbi:MAG: L-ribulose-5-phosphate 4-epimerase [Bacteroidota bacterium]|nr:L-ribulose-5-phosphate 4-epimerase [Bacteroidota bacterium]MDP4204668.1 L-ribulose-5-phosphate 4-epimerase [Bacteroidota bacterium]